MYRVCLTEEQRQQLAERTQHKTTAPKMRARLEMLRLSDKGWCRRDSLRRFCDPDRRRSAWSNAHCHQWSSSYGLPI